MPDSIFSARFPAGLFSPVLKSTSALLPGGLLAGGLIAGAILLTGIAGQARADDITPDTGQETAMQQQGEEICPPVSCDSPFRILALGDSLTAGYGLAQEDGFTVQLQKALNSKDTACPVEILNGGVSGDTSAGGLRRVDWLLSDKPDAVMLALGANDGLRGLSPEEMKKNLAGIIEKIQAAGISRILLIGMLAPPNMGEAYGKSFNQVFPGLAQRYKLAFYPFFLDGVAAEPDLNQEDGIHPNAAGVAEIVQRMRSDVVRLRDCPAVTDEAPSETDAPADPRAD